MDPSRYSWADGGRGRGHATLARDSRAMKLLHALDRAMVRFAWVPNWTLMAALLIVLVQAADRRPPFELLGTEPAAGRPGEFVTIYARVRREIPRECSVSVHRSLHDAAGKRWDFPEARFTALGIAQSESRTPGRMAPTFLIPSSASPGPAEVVTSLQYRCNKTHAIWPIELTHTLPLTILP
jgi:hypothetical protein